MKVKELMTVDVRSCEPTTNLAEATALMWETDCGVLPVVENGKLSGIVTDRDICMALGTRNRAASEITVGEVATRDVETCAPGTDIHAAMNLMRKSKVRRLPVVEKGELTGILALNDLIDAVDRKHGDIDYEQVMNTIKAICEHRSHKRATRASSAPRPVASTAVA